jgi:hypothetical protein
VDVPSNARNIMRVRSIAALCRFGVATAVALKFRQKDSESAVVG